MAQNPPFKHSRKQFPRIGTAVSNKYIGLPGEITIDLDRWEIRLHDGTTPGGKRILNLSQLSAIFLASDSEAGKLDFGTNSRGFLARISSTQYALRKIAVSDGLTIDNPDGVGGNPKINLPSRLEAISLVEAEGTAAIDANDLTESGFYAIESNATHIPAVIQSASAATLVVVKRSSGSLTQLILDITDDMSIWTRSMKSGSWLGWNQLKPKSGTANLLEDGKNTDQRTWSAADLSQFITNKLKDISSEDDSTLYTSKRIIKDSQAGPRISDQVYDGGAPVDGDRWILYTTAGAHFVEGGVNFPDDIVDGDITIQAFIGAAWTTIESIPSTASDQQTLTTAGTTYMLYESNTVFKLVNSDWVAVQTFAGAWDGRFKVQTGKWTNGMTVKGYRNRIKT